MSWLDRPDGSPPAVIAHAAGNAPGDPAIARERGADAFEADVYVHNGRFEARHERAIYPLPVWVERWYVRWAPRSRAGLSTLLAETNRNFGLLLDVKNGGEHAPGIVSRVLAATRDPGVVAISSQFWYILRDISAAARGIPMLYSIDVAAKLDLFLSIMDRDTVPTGVSCRHTLLDHDLVRELAQRGLRTIAWTVDDPERARELASWGVAGITTNDPAAIVPALRGAPA